MSTRRRAGPAVAASLLLHAAALTALILAARRLRPPEPAGPSLVLDLVPPATAVLPARRATAPFAQAVPSLAAASPLATAPAATPQAPPTPPPPALPGTAAAPASSLGPGTPGVGGGGDADGGGARVLGALRALTGCAHLDALRAGPAERERCAARLAEGVRQAARVDMIPPEKRAYYDAVAQAYAAVRAGGGGPGRTPVGPTAPDRLLGQVALYVPGVGCAMKFGAPRGWKAYHDRPPHSLKLGALPCFITPPQALGTEESAVERPASLRERTDDAAHMRKLEPPR